MNLHKMTDREKFEKDERSWKEAVRVGKLQRRIGDEVTRRLFDMKVFYILRWGSDPFTMFKLYVDITRGIRI